MVMNTPQVLLLNLHWELPDVETLKEEKLEELAANVDKYYGLSRTQWFDLSEDDQRVWKKNTLEPLETQAEEWAQEQGNAITKKRIRSLVKDV